MEHIDILVFSETRPDDIFPTAQFFLNKFYGNRTDLAEIETGNGL